MEVSSPIRYREEYIHNSRGMRLFTCSWVPSNQDIKALVCLCHGYAVECSIFMKGAGAKLAEAGYAVFGIDYEGHGKSDGTRCYIANFSSIIDDVATFFKSVGERSEYKNKARFLYGESMGGCVALHLHRKQPTGWNGAVLVAPMCKISEKMKPHPFVIRVLTTLSPLIATWKIVPSKDVIEMAFKDPIKREEIRTNSLMYQGWPRVKTALEMLKASMNIEQRLDEVTLPFLVLHGDADKVTDPECSKELYSSARSFDKELKIYPGMWHGLLVAEPDKNVEIVFNDIVSWLDKRIPARSSYADELKRPNLDVISQFDNTQTEKIQAN
ncbi:hypothetical protein O6H91_02G051100 [Diphasiastrum complanatum]|uniref:Uncharacterized protein n=2 Tax=Diphasiastrum complanatum TaxID=34168 RepID=A0ACC2EFN7_DIPCM|nr:hypothetical protein O6H91_02G051100 [Diphasiastrum complanatum]KAJ7565175.1 hypothetical protein O6H91_02G051100 [Diphasiastrum complanatum]